MARRRRGRKMKWFDLYLDEAHEDASRVREAPCPYQSTCGGCRWQTVTYDHQLELKRRFITESFASAGLDLDVPLPVASPREFRYRNRMEFTFAPRRWATREELDSGEPLDRGFALGLHAPGGFDRVMRIDTCLIQPETGDAILRAVHDFAKSSDLPAWNTRSHEGFWRHAIVRCAAGTDDALVMVVTSERRPEVIEALADRLTADGVAVTTVANGVTNRHGDTTEGAEIFVDRGSSVLRERVDGLDFEIPPAGFFQPNAFAAADLFALVKEMAGAGNESRVLDLFCGGGALSLVLAREAKSVEGYELSADSVACARRNAELNGVANCRFEALDLIGGLTERPAGEAARPDVLVLDPPRAGCHQRLLDDVVRLAPPRIVSVGCNPATQAANLAHFVDAGGYRIVRSQAVDQYPHTPHVENVVLLERD